MNQTGMALPSVDALFKRDLRIRAVKRLREIQADPDLEGGHVEADKVLCEVLTNLGFGEVAEAFEKIEKWYA